MNLWKIEKPSQGYPEVKLNVENKLGKWYVNFGTEQILVPEKLGKAMRIGNTLFNRIIENAQDEKLWKKRNADRDIMSWDCHKFTAVALGLLTNINWVQSPLYVAVGLKFFNKESYSEFKNPNELLNHLSTTFPGKEVFVFQNRKSLDGKLTHSGFLLLSKSSRDNFLIYKTGSSLPICSKIDGEIYDVHGQGKGTGWELMTKLYGNIFGIGPYEDVSSSKEFKEYYQEFHSNM